MPPGDNENVSRAAPVLPRTDLLSRGQKSRRNS